MLKMKLEQKNLKSVKYPIWGRVYQGWDGISDKIWNQVHVQVSNRIRFHVGQQVYNQIYGQVIEQTYENIRK